MDYLESQKEKIENVIKQMLAIGEIFRKENLQVNNFFVALHLYSCILTVYLFFLLFVIKGWFFKSLSILDSLLW